MRSIFKYDVVEAKNGIIEGPITKLLTAQVQHGSIKVWAEVDTEAENVKYQIIPIGTGWPLDAPAGEQCILDSHQYLSTVQLAGGGLVFHVYAKELTPIKVKKTEPTPEKADRVKKTIQVGGAKAEVVINPEILAVFTR
jgi:hypothetical protein